MSPSFKRLAKITRYNKYRSSEGMCGNVAIRCGRAPPTPACSLSYISSMCDLNELLVRSYQPLMPFLTDLRALRVLGSYIPPSNLPLRLLFGGWRSNTKQHQNFNQNQNHSWRAPTSYWQRSTASWSSLDCKVYLAAPRSTIHRSVRPTSGHRLRRLPSRSSFLLFDVVSCFP